MIQRKLILLIYFLTAVSLLLINCSNEKSKQSENTQSGKELKAKIVYFSIPG